MKKPLLITLFLGIIILNAYSQDANSELLKKLVEKNVLTQDEADEISRESNAETQDNDSFTNTVKKVRNAFNTPYLNFGGYGLFMYQYKQYDRVHHTAQPRLLFISMNGKLNDYFRYFALMEFSDPKLYEFYGEWTAAKEFNLRLGQYKVPFTFENPISPTDLETILNTRSIGSLTGMVGDPLQFNDVEQSNKSGRDIGIQASGSLFNVGDHDLIQYAAGIFQGTGMNIKENNNTKDFAGTLIVQPVKNLRFGAGMYAGKAVYIKPGESIEGDYGRNRWAISADYVNDRFYARAEWINGNDGGIKKEAVYGMAQWYAMAQKLSLSGKVDYYNQDKDISSEATDYTFAVNYYFWTRCRFQVNYTYTDYSKNWGNGRSSENSVQAQMQIVF